ncbi:uncharacterized protein TRIADDRAFT_54523 [Trichoplax adhaerens]|uniref:Nucleolar protein Dnt1-like N-terminal domain-containing protein n=1 Tax=Trichoplax adhaerens TaxID=10228 RepID=B3RSA0_TRIAD|nr:hypothetical protein TRIADDRAFT_54523 [Trichoplax adhaerens]EDV26479.1 hypothetical protein TRIADDRAFT_54523 [Trichoplax adhaerens]|eukprot:XP_002110475.1 hypothetical protein TRIADDRAFT_54523 [Trichoplax adhaerens]
MDKRAFPLLRLKVNFKSHRFVVLIPDDTSVSNAVFEANAVFHRLYPLERDSNIVRLQDDTGCDLESSYPISLAVGNSMEVMGYSNDSRLNYSSIQSIDSSKVRDDDSSGYHASSITSFLSPEGNSFMSKTPAHITSNSRSNKDRDGYGTHSTPFIQRFLSHNHPYNRTLPLAQSSKGTTTAITQVNQTEAARSHDGNSNQHSSEIPLGAFNLFGETTTGLVINQQTSTERENPDISNINQREISNSDSEIAVPEARNGTTRDIPVENVADAVNQNNALLNLEISTQKSISSKPHNTSKLSNTSIDKVTTSTAETVTSNAIKTANIENINEDCNNVSSPASKNLIKMQDNAITDHCKATDKSDVSGITDRELQSGKGYNGNSASILTEDESSRKNEQKNLTGGNINIGIGDDSNSRDILNKELSADVSDGESSSVKKANGEPNNTDNINRSDGSSDKISISHDQSCSSIYSSGSDDGETDTSDDSETDASDESGNVANKDNIVKQSKDGTNIRVVKSVNHKNLKSNEENQSTDTEESSESTDSENSSSSSASESSSSPIVNTDKKSLSNNNSNRKKNFIPIADNKRPSDTLNPETASPRKNLNKELAKSTKRKAKFINENKNDSKKLKLQHSLEDVQKTKITEDNLIESDKKSDSDSINSSESSSESDSEVERTKKMVEDYEKRTKTLSVTASTTTSTKKRPSEASLQRLKTQQTLVQSLSSSKSMKQATNRRGKKSVNFIHDLPKEMLSTAAKNDFDISESKGIQVKESDDLSGHLQRVLRDESAWHKKKKRRSQKAT